LNINTEILASRDSRREQHGTPRKAAAPCLILRLEDVLIERDAARAGAPRFLAEYPGLYAIISSNSRDTACSLAVKLKRIGLDVPESRLVLAGEETLRIIAREQGHLRCLLATSRVIFYAARRLGLMPVQSDAQAVVVGRDASWDHGLLTSIVNEVAGGAKLIGCNQDTAAIGRSGRILPDTGALIAAIEAATGARATYPASAHGGLISHALNRLGCAADEAILVSNAAQDHQHAGAEPDLRRLAPRAGGFAPSELAKILGFGGI
jgi:4-nitrophenyl phosphatase